MYPTIPWALLVMAPLASARFTRLPLRARADECCPCPRPGNSTTVITVTQPATTCSPVTITVALPVTAETVTVTVTHTPPPQQQYTANEEFTAQPQADPCDGLPSEQHYTDGKEPAAQSNPDPCDETPSQQKYTDGEELSAHPQQTDPCDELPSPQQKYTADQEPAAEPSRDPCENYVDIPIEPQQTRSVVVTKTVIIAAQKFPQPETVTFTQDAATAAPDEGPVATVTVLPVPVESPSRPQEPETVPTVVFTDPCPPDTTNTVTTFNTILVTVSAPPVQNVTRFADTAPLDSAQPSSSSSQPVNITMRAAPVRRRW